MDRPAMAAANADDVHSLGGDVDLIEYEVAGPLQHQNMQTAPSANTHPRTDLGSFG